MSSLSGPPPAKKPKFAERMMAQMGWKAGEGLGADGRGRLAPIETQLRPNKVGVGAVREKTKQAKEEEKRAASFRGEKVESSSSEEEKRKRRKKPKGEKGTGVEGGSGTSGTSTPRTKVRKPKYVTAEQVSKDLEGLHIPKNVLDGAFDLAGQNTTYDSPGFVSASKDDEKSKAQRRMKLELVACAETRAALSERKSYLDDSTGHLVGEIDRDREELRRVQDVAALVAELQGFSSSSESGWADMAARLKTLEVDYSARYDMEKYGIHDVAIAAIHPLFRREMQDWEPPEINEELLTTLESLQHLLGIRGQTNDSSLTQKDEYIPLRRNRRSTTPYETMMQTLFLPRVRSFINNSWTPTDPSTLPDLLKRWRTLLPDFIFSHIIEQLLVPRLTEALTSWRPSSSSGKKPRSPPPDTWIFPWLVLLPAHHLDPDAQDGLLVSVKRRLRSALSSHPIASGPPSWLPPWKSLLHHQFSAILTTHLVPRLSSFLSPPTFSIDPADQAPYLPAFQTLLQYATLLPPSTMATILGQAFLPQFLETLIAWVTDESVVYSEVEQWYSWWKGQIPESIRGHETLWGKWTEIFRTMILAVELGPTAARSELPISEFEATNTSMPGSGQGTSTPGRGAFSSSGPGTPRIQEPPPLPDEPLPDVTFKDVVEDWCEKNDLLLVPLREAHGDTGSPLFRITASADQKGGVVVYVRGDLLWVRDKKDKGAWQAVGLDDQALIERAGMR